MKFVLVPNKNRIKFEFNNSSLINFVLKHTFEFEVSYNMPSLDVAPRQKLVNDFVHQIFPAGQSLVLDFSVLAYVLS